MKKILSFLLLASFCTAVFPKELIHDFFDLEETVHHAAQHTNDTACPVHIDAHHTHCELLSFTFSIFHLHQDIKKESRQTFTEIFTEEELISSLFSPFPLPLLRAPPVV